MQLRSALVSIGLLLTLPAVADRAPTVQDVFQLENGLKFDDLYPRQSYFGNRVQVAGWSHDDRYLAYFWNPYRTPGTDLFLYDSRSGQSQRLTSIDKMAAFDSDAEKAKKRYEEEQKRLDEWDTLSDLEYHLKRQEQKEKDEKDRTPKPSYSGPNEVAWANNSNEFLMTFKGDVYRWKLGDDMPKRLTWTRDNENSLEYLPDDSGFVFRRGNDVYRVRFDSAAVVQINPDLENGVQMIGYSISPDGQNMLVYGSKGSSQPGRQVDYIVYRDRFAQARKTTRGVADDDFLGESYLYLYDIREETLKDATKEQKAFEVWKWTGGEEWQETSISSDPWSPDGRFFAFGTWKRDQKDFRIMEANIAERKVYPIHIGTSDGEHRTPSLAQPFYTADGENLIALMDTSGWRHAWVLPRGSEDEWQLTTGYFEVYPQELSADGKSIIVTSSKEELSQLDIYKVSLEDGAMTRLSKLDGQHTYYAKAENSDKIAAQFNSWDQMRELFVIADGQEKQVTESHDSEGFWKSVTIKPELFTFKNRHGDTIHGYKFLPPNYDRSVERPLFVYVYGGPLGTGKSVENGSFQSTGFQFNLYLAQTLGYVTCVIDPRGQSGYSAEFGKANWEQAGKAQTEDLTDLVKYMDETHNIDRTRVGLTGWSFGGFQTQHAMYTEPDVFTLGIAGAGPTQWQNYNTWYSGGVIGNAAKGKPEDLDKYSLTNVARNLKNPLMLLHGMEDTNVLYQDTVFVYRSLLQAGKGHLVELALDPTGGHGMGGDMDTRDRHLIYLAFIVKHWGLPEYLNRD